MDSSRSKAKSTPPVYFRPIVNDALPVGAESGQPPWSKDICINTIRDELSTYNAEDYGAMCTAIPTFHASTAGQPFGESSGDAGPSSANASGESNSPMWPLATSSNEVMPRDSLSTNSPPQHPTAIASARETGAYRAQEISPGAEPVDIRASAQNTNPRLSQQVQRNHHRYFCELHRAQFTRNSDLQRHFDTVHNRRGERHYCAYPGCTYSTRRLDKLKEHCRKQHKQPLGNELYMTMDE